MAVRIRLTRMGSKKRPFYRLIAANSEAPRDGKFLDILGYYDPKKDPPDINLKEERIKYWLKNGAMATESARAILKRQGLMQASSKTD